MDLSLYQDGKRLYKSFFFPENCCGVFIRMETNIYVITNNNKAPKFSLPEGYSILNAGGAGDSKNIIGDNSDDNISERNKNFCELTGIYWLLKNKKIRDKDIIGICHYRRYFLSHHFLSLLGQNRPIEKKDIDVILKQKDAIVSKKILRWTVYNQYSKIHYKKDIELTRKTISILCPEYLVTFDKVMKSHEMCIGNMIITTYDIFSSYFNWLFNILFHLEAQIDITAYDSYQQRIYGFIAERLMLVWLRQNKIKLKSLPVTVVK